jgi:hypothetical protein
MKRLVLASTCSIALLFPIEAKAQWLSAAIGTLAYGFVKKLIHPDQQKARTDRHQQQSQPRKPTKESAKH